MVLYAAVRQHGAPEALVSDGGSIFRAKQAHAIYTALGISKEEIARRQPWQSYIETQLYVIWNSDSWYTWCGNTAKEAGGDHGPVRGPRYDPMVSLSSRRGVCAWVSRSPAHTNLTCIFHIINAQRRMADFHFAQAQTWQELLDAHDQWVADFNFQVHWAHRERQDQRQSPAEVLGWVNGRVFSPEQLDRIFYATRFGRRLDRAGYVRFRHWRLYGEEGLSGRRAAVWLFKETLTVEYAEEALSQFAVVYQLDKQHLRAVTRPQRFETRYRSPQLPLWAEGEVEWRLVIRRPEYQPRARRRSNDYHVRQQSLFA
jgi:hypothetical protein